MGRAIFGVLLLVALVFIVASCGEESQPTPPAPSGTAVEGAPATTTEAPATTAEAPTATREAPAAEESAPAEEETPDPDAHPQPPEKTGPQPAG